jgi:hypothetical protein
MQNGNEEWGMLMNADDVYDTLAERECFRLTCFDPKTHVIKTNNF